MNIEKRKLLDKSKSILNKFINKVNDDPNVILDEENIYKIFNSLPNEYKYGERIYLAGSYEEDNIIGYDKDGEIIRLGYERNFNTVRQKDNYKFEMVKENVPVFNYDFDDDVYGYTVLSNEESLDNDPDYSVIPNVIDPLVDYMTNEQTVTNINGTITYFPSTGTFKLTNSYDSSQHNFSFDGIVKFKNVESYEFYIHDFITDYIEFSFVTGQKFAFNPNDLDIIQDDLVGFYQVHLNKLSSSVIKITLVNLNAPNVTNGFSVRFMPFISTTDPNESFYISTIKPNYLTYYSFYHNDSLQNTLINRGADIYNDIAISENSKVYIKTNLQEITFETDMNFSLNDILDKEILLALVIVNLENIQDYKLYNFKNNLELGGYTYNIDILNKSFRHLPHHMRDADLTMVAGAYKTGAIAMMDKAGNIVDLGFSRSTSGYRLFNDLVDTPINTPRLDNMCYGFASGYTIEESNTFIGWTIPSGINLTRTLGTSLLSNPHIYRETAASGAKYAELGGSSAVWSSVDTSVTYNILIRGINQTARRLAISSASDNNERAMFDLVDGTVISIGTRVQSASIRSLNNGFYLLNVTVVPAVLPITTFRVIRLQPSLVNNLTNFLGDTTKGFDIVSASISNKPIEGFTVNPVNNTVVTKAADTMTPITLTNEALIHIKTAKGIQEFILSAGTLNINDYVVNDKLICFAIKYIPDIEDFIDNLTLDGTYTFDENVIRDSWSDLMNRLSTNSTLLHQFLSSDHIVLPYAYKTGYVAAMDLSDGSIVDIEFERKFSGTALATAVNSTIFNGDIVNFDEDQITYTDMFVDNSLGYVLGFNQIAEGSMHGIVGLNTVLTPPPYLNLSTIGRIQSATTTIRNSSVQISMPGLWIGTPQRQTFKIIVKTIQPIKIDLIFRNNVWSTASYDLETDVAIRCNKFDLSNGYKLLEFYTHNSLNSGSFVDGWLDITRKDSVADIDVEFMSLGGGQLVISSDKYNNQRQFRFSRSTGNHLQRRRHVERDWLKTESYSRIVTLGAITGMKVGSYTDPQSLVINDKVNFILLKQ